MTPTTHQVCRGRVDERHHPIHQSWLSSLWLHSIRPVRLPKPDRASVLRVATPPKLAQHQNDARRELPPNRPPTYPSPSLELLILVKLVATPRELHQLDHHEDVHRDPRADQARCSYVLRRTRDRLVLMYSHQQCGVRVCHSEMIPRKLCNHHQRQLLDQCDTSMTGRPRTHRCRGIRLVLPSAAQEFVG